MSIMIILIFLLITTFAITTINISTDNDQVAEKVYLHIDRVYYNSGDDIWFKAYVIDPATNRLSFNTNNLHVELIAPDLRIVQRRIIRIEKGLGNGDFHLDDFLVSGKYIIRAYTNHMRNFDHQFFFRKEITVINPYLGDPELHHDTLFAENKLYISFYPEGGSLVDNVSSTVAFKAVNTSGKGCDVTGEVWSSSGDSITSFKSSYLGMGSFTLRPLPGLSYYAIIKGPSGIEAKTYLPESFPTGFAISAFLVSKNKLFLLISTNNETFSSLTDKNFSLILSSRNVTVKTTKIEISSLINNFDLPAEDFPDGILRIKLTDSKGIPLCERLLFFQNNNDVRLNIVTDRKEYKPREKTHVNLSLSGDSAFSESGAFSLSAAEAQYTEKYSLFPTSIASWFLLESDIRGPVEEPSSYFDPDNKDRGHNLDLLLLTHGWRDFQWKYDSLSPYKHEIGFNITGKVKRTLGDKSVKGVKINMGIFGKNISRVLNSETDSSGSFSFEGIDLVGEGKLLVAATNNRKRVVGNLFVDSLFYEPAEIDEKITFYPEQDMVSLAYTAFKKEATIKISEKKRYRLSDTLELGEVFITAKRIESPQEHHIGEARMVYGNPDKELVITPALENSSVDILSLLSGRIPGVRVAGSGININIVLTRSVPPGPALLFLDGIEVPPENVQFILSQSSFTVERIDVLNPTPLLGMRGANGAINIITRIGTGREPKELDPGSKAIIVRGFHEPGIFYSPKHDAPDEGAFMPDIRTTIFWEPNVYVNSDSTGILEYFNADKPATINIIAEGITEGGIPVSGKVSYIVK